MTDLKQSLAGVIGIEGIPLWGSSSIIPRMKDSIDNSVHMRGAIAYLTADQDFISSQLTIKLSDRSSFLCVDFHRPTDIGILCAMRRSKANVYLHIAKLPPGTVPSRIGMPPHLLHTKMLLFDKSNGTSELWVGSHNWTPRALDGINIEYSLIVSMQQDSPIYIETAQYLEKIREKLCQLIDPSLESYYLELQGQEEDPAVTMELEGDNVESLDGESITIFGTDRDELVQVNRVGRRLFVVMTDSSTSIQYVYESEILQTGLLTASEASAGGISFSQRRFAFRRGRTYPSLETSGVPPQSVIDAAFYFITVSLRSKVYVDLFDPEKKKLWETSFDISQAERLDERAERQFKRGQPIFQVPTGPNYEKVEKMSGMLLLEEKRQSHEFPLFAKKIIRPKSDQNKLQLE
jgi:hypothetical protein